MSSQSLVLGGGLYYSRTWGSRQSGCSLSFGVRPFVDIRHCVCLLVAGRWGLLYALGGVMGVCGLLRSVGRPNLFFVFIWWPLLIRLTCWLEWGGMVVVDVRVNTWVVLVSRDPRFEDPFRCACELTFSSRRTMYSIFRIYWTWVVLVGNGLWLWGQGDTRRRAPHPAPAVCGFAMYLSLGRCLKTF